MANDPNRDFLPVKDVDDRSSKGVNCRMDLNIIGKLKRCDLEDRYMRLYDENTQIKKQLNCQEEKIKRLGTKLLRLIGEKKNCPDSCRRRQDGKGVDELQMRIIELEHENYTLKDRNVVLKQQLANHARQHVAAHRSPNRSIHNSPRMSQRQTSAPNVNDSSYMLSNRNQAHDIQLREAEEHINGLNDEIKSLHNKIDILQQDLEKSSLENQKTKVCENIELIRLQRSLKQQSVQIAALQAQIKNSEKNQKLLRDELTSAHKENEESLQVISDKQKEILDLYTKLEERNVGRLECEEMKERIKDLTSERDTLRERGEFLMKTIESKSSEADMVKELKRLLESEKSKKKELKESLENTQKLLQSLKDVGKVSQSSEEAISKETITEDADKTFGTVEKKSRSDLKNGVDNELDLLASTHLVYHSERNSDSLQTDSKVEDRKGGKFSMGNTSNHETARKNAKGEIKKSGSFQNVSHDGNTEIYSSGRSGSQSTPETFESIQTLGGVNCYVKGDEPVPGPTTPRSNSDVASMSVLPQPLQFPKVPPVSQIPHHSQIPPVSQIPHHSQIPPVSQIPHHSQIPPVSQIPHHSQIPPVSQIQHYSQAPQVSEKQQHSQGPQAPQVSEKQQHSQRPQAPQVSEKQQHSQRPQAPQVSEKQQHSQGPQAMPASQEKVVSKKKNKSKAVKKFGAEQNLDVNKAPPTSQEKVLEKDSQGPQAMPASQVSKVQSFDEIIHPHTFIKLTIDWLQLRQNTSVWNDESIKLLYVDFAFFDVRGEETETPVSIKKPKNPNEKCFFNFTTSIRITRERAKCLRLIRYRWAEGLIIFKVVSEPEESNEECVDIGVAKLTVKEFFRSSPNSRIVLPVFNTKDLNEFIGYLSVRLDISPD